MFLTWDNNNYDILNFESEPGSSGVKLWFSPIVAFWVIFEKKKHTN